MLWGTLYGMPKFQSTPSAWRVTLQLVTTIILLIISIHALRVEGDRWELVLMSRKATISIHTLRVEGDDG